jgi:hypothetical protein
MPSSNRPAKAAAALDAALLPGSAAVEAAANDFLRTLLPRAALLRSVFAERSLAGPPDRSGHHQKSAIAQFALQCITVTDPVG